MPRLPQYGLWLYRVKSLCAGAQAGLSYPDDRAKLQGCISKLSLGTILSIHCHSTPTSRIFLAILTTWIIQVSKIQSLPVG